MQNLWPWVSAALSSLDEQRDELTEGKSSFNCKWVCVAVLCELPPEGKYNKYRDEDSPYKNDLFS